MCSLRIFFLFLSLYCDHLYLHSFPTRRSSDLFLLFLSDQLFAKIRQKIFRPRSQPEFFSSMQILTRFRSNLADWPALDRSEEHTSELQSLRHLVCRLLLEKKKNKS